MTNYLVQGSEATLPEFNTAQALKRLDIEFIFQVPLGGGFSRRGGVVIDFLIENPFPIAIEVEGEYWHTGRRSFDEAFRESMIRHYAGRITEIIHIAAHRLQTVDDATRTLRQELRI
jgi:hypothetical protein